MRTSDWVAKCSVFCFYIGSDDLCGTTVPRHLLTGSMALLAVCRDIASDFYVKPSSPTVSHGSARWVNLRVCSPTQRQFFKDWLYAYLQIYIRRPFGKQPHVVYLTAHACVDDIHGCYLPKIHNSCKQNRVMQLRMPHVELQRHVSVSVRHGC